MEFANLNKRTLVQIAMHDKVELDLRYAAARELQLRWNSDMLSDLVRLHGQGKEAWEIAEYLGITAQEVGKKILQYRLRRVTA